MTDLNIEMFLMVTAKAFMKAAESNDADLQHEVIKNTKDVIESWEQKAFNMAYKHMLENRES